MIEFVKRLLWDETAFVRYLRTSVALVGYLMEQGYIPTGIENGGNKIGGLLMATALFLGSGTADNKPKE